MLNLAPIGCYPAFLVELPHNASDIDSFGCLISYNNAVVDYNTMLEEALKQTRREIGDANVVYTDIHSVMLELFHHPTSHGNNIASLNSRKHTHTDVGILDRDEVWDQVMLWIWWWCIQF